MGFRPSWLRTWGKVVTATPPTRIAQVRCSLLCLQRQVAKLARELYSWSLLRNNNTAINLQCSLQVTVIGVLPHVTYGTRTRGGTHSLLHGHAHRRSNTEFVTRKIEGRGARLIQVRDRHLK